MREYLKSLIVKISLITIVFSLGMHCATQAKGNGACSVHFNNYTHYTINVYMDGVFWGTIAPYGNGNVTGGEGYTKIYCVTVGGTYSWTASGNCDHAFEYDMTLANAESLDETTKNQVVATLPKNTIKDIADKPLKKYDLANEIFSGGFDADLKILRKNDSSQIKSNVIYEGEEILFRIDYKNIKHLHGRYRVYVCTFHEGDEHIRAIYPDYNETDGHFVDSNSSETYILPKFTTVQAPFGANNYFLCFTKEPLINFNLFQTHDLFPSKGSWDNHQAEFKPNIGLFLKNSPVSDVTTRNIAYKTSTFDTKPLREKTYVNPIEDESSNSSYKTYTYSTGNKNEILRSRTNKKTIDRDSIPNLFIIQPVIDTMTRGLDVSDGANTITIQGVATDNTSGIKTILINNNVPEFERKEVGFFQYSYYPFDGDNQVTVSVENNRGFIKEQILRFRYNTKRKEIRPISRKYLVVIGLNNYRNSNVWHNLRHGVKDAIDFANLMRSEYGFADSNIIAILDTDATRQNIMDKLYNLKNIVKSNDDLLIYYSGHGYYENDMDEGYWIPIEGDLSIASYVLNEYTLKCIAAIKSRKTFLIADACYSGSLLQGSGKVKLNQHPDKMKDKARILLASGRLENVSDGGINDANSPFATAILEYFINSSDSLILSSDLINYVIKNVPKTNTQQPISGVLMDTGDEQGEFIFERKKLN